MPTTVNEPQVCTVCNSRTGTITLLFADGEDSGYKSCRTCAVENRCGVRYCAGCTSLFINGSLEMVRRNGHTQNVYLCHACMGPRRYASCQGCDVYWLTNTLTPQVINGVAYSICPECLDSSTACRNCDVHIIAGVGSRWLPGEDRGTVRPFCNRCFSNVYQCNGCRVFIDTRPRNAPRQSMRIGADDNYYCTGCYNERFSTCPGCDNSFLTENGTHDDETSELLCNRCYRRRFGNRFNERNEIEGTIFEYSARAPALLRVTPDPTKLLFGMELELAVSQDVDREAVVRQVYRRARRRVICKSDSSIGYGFEMVSAPYSLEESKKLLSDILLPTLPNLVESPTCGMHVHFSRATLNQAQLARLILFGHSSKEDNVRFMNYMAGRDLTGGGGGRYASIRPRAWRDFSLVSHDTRYNAFNFSNPSTVECRIFAGTSNAIVAQENLEFCAALVEFTRPGSRTLREVGEVGEFIKFVLDARKVYPLLNNKFIRDNVETLYPVATKSARIRKSVQIAA